MASSELESAVPPSSQSRMRPWRPSLIQFSPFDLRVYLRIVAFLLAWKVLSTDYGALPALIQHGPELYPYQSKVSRSLVHFYQPLFLDQAWKIVSLQIVGALCLLAAIVWVRRSLLIAGLLVVMLIEWSAYQYREYIWSFEVPLAALTIMALWPVTWTKTFSAIGGGRRPSVEANSLGRALMLYFSGSSGIRVGNFGPLTL